MHKQKQVKRTRKAIGLSYLYYLTSPKILIKEWYPRYKLNGVTFLALAKTDRYYIITDNATDYQTAKTVKPKANFPELYHIRKGFSE